MGGIEKNKLSYCASPGRGEGKYNGGELTIE